MHRVTLLLQDIPDFSNCTLSGGSRMPDTFRRPVHQGFWPPHGGKKNFDAENIFLLYDHF